MKSSTSLSLRSLSFLPCVFVFFFSAKTATRPVLADGHDGIETECDVCHVNYYHKVCVCVCVVLFFIVESSIANNDFGGEGGGFFRTASSSRLSFPIYI
jgi:hypothetical protein